MQDWSACAVVQLSIKLASLLNYAWYCDRRNRFLAIARKILIIICTDHYNIGLLEKNISETILSNLNTLILMTVIIGTERVVIWRNILLSLRDLSIPG